MIVNVIFFDVSYVSSVDVLLFLSLTFSSRRPDSIACCNLSRCQILQERRENFLLQCQLSVLTLISVSVPPPYYRSST